MMLKVTAENGNSLGEGFQICVRQVDKEKWKLRQKDYNPINTCYILHCLAYFLTFTAHNIMK